MSEVKKYRLGNDSEQYELSEKYLGWVPESMKDWEMFHHEYSLGRSYPNIITLVSPSNEKKTLNVHQRLAKDAFPLNFLREVRAAEWWKFLMVSEQETPNAKFIIPMY